jgi:hypothetical protein
VSKGTPLDEVDSIVGWGFDVPLDLNMLEVFFGLTFMLFFVFLLIGV